MISTEKAKVTCTECRFEWFGNTAAHALRTVGRCTRCRGQLLFSEEAPTLPTIVDVEPNVPAHLVLGTPRI